MIIRTLHAIPDDIQGYINVLLAGRPLPAIHIVDVGDGIWQALEGTHRLAAYKLAGKQPIIIEVDFEENKDTPIIDIIGKTDGDNDIDPDMTLAEYVDKYYDGIDINFDGIFPALAGIVKIL